MDDNLSKSRRNLIVVSALLVIFDVAKVSVAKVSVLGTELLVGNPKIVSVVLWVLWAYLLLRYLQQLGAQTDLGIHEKYVERMDHLLRDKMAQIGKRDFPEWSGNLAEVGYRLVSRRSMSWTQPLHNYDPAQGKQIELGLLRVPALLMIASSVHSFLFVALATPRATDHIFPLLLALAAPVAGFFRWS